MNEKLPTKEKCPHCGAEREIPKYAYAHWYDRFTVTCGNEACGKKYRFFQGETSKLREAKK